MPYVTRDDGVKICYDAGNVMDYLNGKVNPLEEENRQPGSLFPAHFSKRCHGLVDYCKELSHRSVL